MVSLAVWQVMQPRIARILKVCGLLFLGFAYLPGRAELSAKIHAEITASFPKFAHPSADPPAPSPVGTPAPLEGDSSIMLPVYHIREKRVPDGDPDLWLSKREIARKAMNEYVDSMTDLEWALNCWYIPFITPSPQARADARYAENKIRHEHRRLSLVTETLARLDPAEAKKLLRDLDFSSHPGK